MSKQSSFVSLHQANGALLADYAGWLLPSHFGDPAIEYQSVRSSAGLLDLSDRAVLTITGPDRMSYLQGLISNDLRPLLPGQGLYAAFLNQQGKVLGDCRVLCTEDSLVLELWEPIKRKILDHLNRYLVADEVEIDDLAGRYASFSLQGPAAEAILQNFLHNDRCPQQPLAHSMVQLDGVETRLCRYSHTGEHGFDLTVSAPEVETIARRFSDAGSSYSIRWVGQEARQQLRVEAGIPLYGIDVTEENLILETGLNHAVSFTKGCYLGQEVVERIRSRGHVNRQLAGLLIEGANPASAGSKIISADKEIGWITSSVFSPAVRAPIALGYIRRDQCSPGTRLVVQDDSTALNSTVTALPFIAHAPSAPSS